MRVPSLYLISRTRAYAVVRIAGAALALVAATGWALDRLGLVANPFTPVEDALIASPLWVVGGLAVLAVGGWRLRRRPRLSAGVSDTPRPPAARPAGAAVEVEECRR